MPFGRKKKEEEEKTMAEAIVELGKSMKTITSRLDKIEEQPKEVKTETPTTPVEQPQQPQVKVDTPRYIVQDVATQTTPTIYDLKDPKNPKPLDLHAAIVEVLNVLPKIEKALG